MSAIEAARWSWRCSSATARDPTHRLTLLIRDGVGSPIAARVRVLGSDGRLHPDSADAARLVHLARGGYFYAAGSCWIDLPAGETRITAGSGFERRPWDETIEIRENMTVTIVLDRIVDLGSARLVARAERLSVIHCLDQEQHSRLDRAGRAAPAGGSSRGPDARWGRGRTDACCGADGRGMDAMPPRASTSSGGRGAAPAFD